MQAAHGVEGHDVGGRRLAEQDRNLAEERAAAEDGHVAAVGPDRDLAFQDDVEARAGQALAQDPVSLGEPDFFELVGDRFELRTRQVREQGQSPASSSVSSNHLGHGHPLGRDRIAAGGGPQLMRHMVQPAGPRSGQIRRRSFPFAGADLRLAQRPRRSLTRPAAPDQHPVTPGKPGQPHRRATRMALPPALCAESHN